MDYSFKHPGMENRPSIQINRWVIFSKHKTWKTLRWWEVEKRVCFLNKSGSARLTDANATWTISIYQQRTPIHNILFRIRIRALPFEPNSTLVAVKKNILLLPACLLLGRLGLGSVGGTREELKVELLLLRVQNSQLRWFGNLVRIPPQWLPGEVLLCGRSAWGCFEIPWLTGGIWWGEKLLGLHAEAVTSPPGPRDRSTMNLAELFFGHFNKKKEASSSSFQSFFRVTLFTAHQNSSSPKLILPVGWRDLPWSTASNDVFSRHMKWIRNQEFVSVFGGIIFATSRSDINIKSKICKKENSSMSSINLQESLKNTTKADDATILWFFSWRTEYHINDTQI